LAVALAKKAGVKRIWMGTPSWPNHAQIAADVGVEIKGFAHATKAGVVDMDALRAAIAAAEPTDAIMLHGCCHNPTGIDYTNAQWDEIAGLLKAKGCCRSSIWPIRAWARAWRRTPMASAACWPRCPRR
jgi:aromatic-amino-acid transaminase